MAIIAAKSEVGYMRERIRSSKWLMFWILTVSSFFFTMTNTAKAATTNQISQFGITWTFDQAYEYGQFVNGDYWVVGPVTITDIDPASTDISGRVINGSMINPNGDNNSSGNETNTHGFDSLASGFDSALNVARPGAADLNGSNPLVIQANKSLVSSKSFADDKGGNAQLEDFAVLTVLSAAPPDNSFRPAYASVDKTINYNLTDINFDALSDLTIAGGSAPSLTDVTNWFKYPTISIAHSTRSAEIGGNRYSQHDDYTERLGRSLLLLNCNFTDNDKQTPLIHILQNGIDRYGVLTTGGRKIWRSNGAWHMGIKLTIMATAKVLSDNDMLSDITNKSGNYWEDGAFGRQTWPTITSPSDHYYFSEDGDTFTMSSWDIGTAPFVLWSRGGSYDAADRYQDKGNVNVTNGSTTVIGVGTTWLDMDYKGNYDAPGVWFGVTNDDQASSRTGRVYDVDAIVSNTELRLATPYTDDTNQTGDTIYMVGIAIAYGHKNNPGSWNGYRGSDLNEPPESSLNYPSWQDYYINSLNSYGINFEVWPHGYRGNCGRNYGSQALPVLIMGLKSAWNHDVFFDYTDRYIAWSRDAGEDNSAFQDQFTEDMWDAYRTDYGTVWTADSNNSNSAPILAAIGSKSVNEASALSFTISATDADSDPITYTASNLPSGASFSSPTFSWTPGYADTGTYNVTFTASDGTDSDSEVVTITVGNTNQAPVLASIGAKSSNENFLLSFTISATDADGDSITYSASNLPTGATFSSGSFSWTPGYTQSGSYNVTFTASDGAATDSEVVTITVSNVNRTPVLASIGNKSVNEGTGLSFSASATDADSDSITYSASNLPSGATFSSGSFNWTPGYTQAGSYSVTFTASDGAASDSETISITVSNVNRAPVLASIGSKSVNEGAGLSFSTSATDADGDSITYSASNLPTGATFSSGSFNWTPGYAQAGSYSVTFTASDGTDSDSEVVTITAGNVNRSPVLATIGEQSVDEGSLLSFSLSATDADGDSISYSADTLPSGSTFTGQSFVWTPGYAMAGIYEVIFAASDGAAQDSETISITVNNTNRAPVLDAISNQSVSETVLLTFAVSATDADDDTLVYSASSLPTGAALSGQTFTWTPSHSQADLSYQMTFTVSDGDLTDSQTVTLTVSDTSPPTVASRSPAADSIQAPLNSLISLHVADDGKGVDAATVIITLDGNIIYTGDTSNYVSASGNCRRAGTSADYVYAYQPSDSFDFDETKAVTVNASDLGGNAMAEMSYSFRTEMRSFGANKSLGSDIEGLDKASPATVCDSSGNIWAVWHAGAAGGRDVYLAKLTAGSSAFGASTRITTSSTDQCNPAIALGTDDKLYVVWQDNRNGDWDIYASTSTNGTSWTTKRRIADSNDNQINPALAVDSQATNRTHLVWEDDRSGNQDIYIAVSSNAFLTNTITRITSNTSDQTSPAIAVDSSDTAHVVWTDARGATADIYGASAGSWTNVPIVNKSANQSSPAIAVESTGSILHFVWMDLISGDSDIYYASSDGLPSNPLAGTNLIDDNTNAEQLSPALVVTGSTGDNLKVFVCWQDRRNADTDLYMTQANSANGTNVLVGDASSNSPQSEPALGTDQYDQPYLVWTDERGANNEIYFAASTFMQPTVLTSQAITAGSGGTVGTDPGEIDSVDDVSVVIPAGASSYDATISITEIENPPAFALQHLSSYDFGPSGIAFTEPVTITIPYAVSPSDPTPTAYWYDSLTGALSQQGITNVETIVISPTLHALRFQTTHFTAFYVAAAAALGGGGGGGGGGCSMSPAGNGNVVDFVFPYILLAIAMSILKLRDARNRKERNIARGKRL